MVVFRGKENLAGSRRASTNEGLLPSYSCIVSTGTPLWSADFPARGLLSCENRMQEMARHEWLLALAGPLGVEGGCQGMLFGGQTVSQGSGIADLEIDLQLSLWTLMQSGTDRLVLQWCHGLTRPYACCGWWIDLIAHRL